MSAQAPIVSVVFYPFFDANLQLRHRLNVAFSLGRYSLQLIGKNIHVESAEDHSRVEIDALALDQRQWGTAQAIRYHRCHHALLGGVVAISDC